MTTTNNTNYSVKALVAKYHNFVIENAPTKEIHHFNGTTKIAPLSRADYHPYYHLIITLYNAVAGSKADKQVQQVMSEYANQYYKDALTSEEFNYLCENFTETISECLTHGVSWKGDQWNYYGLFLSSRKERLLLTEEMLHPQDGSTLYIVGTGCDVAALYPNCDVKGELYEDDYDGDWTRVMLGRIWLFSKGIKPQITIGAYSFDIFDDSREIVTVLPTQGSVDCVVYGGRDKSNRNLNSLYDLLAPNGKMLVFANSYQLCAQNAEWKDFRDRIVCEKAISSIVSFEEKPQSSDTLWEGLIEVPIEHTILLVLEKTIHDSVLVESRIKQKSKKVSVNEMDAEMLWPGYYLADKPSNGMPLSVIANLATDFKKEYIDLDYLGDDEENMIEIYPDEVVNLPVIGISDLSTEYKDAYLYAEKLKTFSEAVFEKKYHIKYIDQPCVCLSGKQELVAGYVSKIPDSGLITWTFADIACLIPKKGVDIRYLCALLLSPSIRSQIMTLYEGNKNIGNINMPAMIDKIIVPNHNEKERLQFLLEANYEAMLSSQKELKEEQDNFKKAVRMRKHALTQSLSAIQSSFNALNSFRIRNNGVISNDDRISRIRKTTVGETFDGISQKLKDMMPIMEHMADVEYSFGKTEWVDPEKFLSDYIDHRKKTWIDFEPIKDWTPGQNKVQNDIIDPQSKKVLYKKGDALHKIWFAPKALEKVLDNIVANAMAHGFTDANRDDYQLRFSWEKNDFSLLIKVENNGSPIPAGHDTASLLQYGVSSSLHHDGHNGIGCHEIDDIMQRYEGSIRIVSTPDEEFTVKYLLTFQSNLIQISNETI